MDLHRVMDDDRRELTEFFGAERCIIATTATSVDDIVFVTLPNSESPATRVEVGFWALGVEEDAGQVVARYPQRNQRGVVIYMDTGELCLIY